MLESDRFIRLPEVENYVGLKSSQICEFIKSGEFPSPIKLGAASRWSENEVRSWIAERKAETRANA